VGFPLGLVSLGQRLRVAKQAVDSEGRTIWIVDAHGYGKRFIVRADEMLTAFLELESAISRATTFSDRGKVDNFLFEIGLSFAFRDE
jgi:hypothetical protein